MGSNAWSGVLAVATAIVGLAVLAVIVSKNSDTTGVLTSAGQAFSGAITAAVSPIASSTGLGSVYAPVNSTFG